MARFLLDTNLLLGFIREAPWALWTHEEFNLGDQEVMAFTSVICRGQNLALAEKNGWGSDRRTRLEEVLQKDSDARYQQTDGVRRIRQGRRLDARQTREVTSGCVAAKTRCANEAE